MVDRIEHSELHIAKPIYDLVNKQICPGTGIDPDQFWSKFAALISHFAPINRKLLEKRENLQAQIDSWHHQHRGNFNFADYKAFLQSIGYLVPDGADFSVTPTNVDPEIAQQAGPQLVVPIMNARFALNAVNARWGSLYDALYGNDVISEQGGAEKVGAYNPLRGQKVIDYGRDFLDNAVPLTSGSHHGATAYQVLNQQLAVSLEDGTVAQLADAEQFVGYLG